MRILLDTHVWLWSIASPERFCLSARRRLSDKQNQLYLSAASVWEIAIKYQLGKLPLPCPPDEFIPPRLVRDSITPLAVEHSHALAVARLPQHHRDPFDRLLISQALTDQLTLFTADEQLGAYNIECVFVHRPC